MDPVQLYTASRLVIVAGKGGVGKTTVAACLAFSAARQGRRTLLVEVEGKSALASMFGVDALDASERELAPNLFGIAVQADSALAEYLRDHGMGRLTNRLVRSGVLDVVATAAPGIGDILVLGKVKQLERSGRYDLIVLDAPAAGHAVQFLQSAHGLLDAVSIGPIHTQAADVVALLTDPARCSVWLVTLPEETPVSELIDTAFALEERVGVSLGPVVVNGRWPERPFLDVDPAEAAAEAGLTVAPGDVAALRTAAALSHDRLTLQTAEIARLSHDLPLPQLHLRQLFTATIGMAELTSLAEELEQSAGALAS